MFKEQGKLQQAIAHYQEAIKIDPSFADAFSNLGTCHVQYFIISSYFSHVSEPPEQETCPFVSPVRISIFNYFLYHYLTGNAFKDAGKIEDAIACYSTAINLEPNYAGTLKNLFCVNV